MTDVGFIIAAYTLTAIILIGYTVSLLRRLSRARRGESSEKDAAPFE